MADIDENSQWRKDICPYVAGASRTFIRSPRQFHLPHIGLRWNVISQATVREARMSRGDLIVLIPSGVLSVIYILVCLWLEISVRRTQHRSPPSDHRIQDSSDRPADNPDIASPEPGRGRICAGERPGLALELPRKRP